MKQIQRNIELIRYRRFGSELLMLDRVAATSMKGAPVITAIEQASESATATPGKYKTISAVIEELDAAMLDRFEALRAYIMALGDDVQHLTQPCQPSPEGSPGRPAHRPFRGLLGVHSRCGLHTRAVTVFRDPLPVRHQPLRHAAMRAPVAPD